MSLISNIHTAVIYDAKKTKPMLGQRLVVTKAKADAKGNYGPHLQQTMATSIPQLTRELIDFNDVNVQNTCVEWFKKTQNEMITDRIKSGKKEITTDELGISGLLNYLNDSGAGGAEKWTIERIAEWFSEALAETIGLILMEKGFTDDKVEKSLNGYSKLLSETLGSRAVISKVKAREIKKALDLGNQADLVMIKFQARIDKVLKEDSLDESLGL